MAATPVRMPKLGLTMEEGRVVHWPHVPGARVEKRALLVVIETEKAESEIEATTTGFLRHIYVPEGETVPCGTLLAALTDAADEAFDAAVFAREHGAETGGSAAATGAGAAQRDAPARAGGTPARAAGAARAGGPAAPAAPAARALARELGIDVALVPGSGPGGRITRQDVEAFAAAGAESALAAGAERVAVAPGVALECLRAGAGDPVLLLPGFGVDVSAFAPQAADLAERHALVGLAPRGVGGSSAPALPRYEVTQAAADALAALDALGVTAPVHVVGASLGAAVALELALAQPARVRSLALLTPFAKPTPRLVAFADAWARVAAEASAETLARALLPWLFSDALLGDDERRERTLRGLAPMLARSAAPALARSAAGLRAWPGVGAEALARLRVPTLVLVAEHDLVAPGGDVLAKAMAGATLERVAGAGHAVAAEAPEAVTAALRAHLERA